MPKKSPSPSAKSFSQYHLPVDYRDTWRIFRIMAEFVDGYQFLGKFKKTITFFGSARTPENDEDYAKARQTAYLLGQAGYTIITGGGPGIMEAGNRGASEAEAESVGLNIQLPNEQVVNKYVKKSLGFDFFFSRKVMLATPAEAVIFFSGGYGTLDEFFEIVDLIEINKIPRVPIVMVGKKFWEPIMDFLKTQSLGLVGAVKKRDLERLEIVDTPEEAVAFILKNTGGKITKPSEMIEAVSGQTMNWRIFRIMAELVEGFEFLSKESSNDDITILGTKSVEPQSAYYQLCYDLAKHLGKKKYTIITGGGPGIMEAGNKGAVDGQGRSIAFSMRFDHEVRQNQYVQDGLSFYFPFTRKLIITMPSLAFVFFPGGFGTLHQLFEVLTLMQTGKTAKATVILFDKKFWTPLDDFIKDFLAKQYKTISDEDLNLYQVVDSIEEAIKLIPKIK